MILKNIEDTLDLASKIAKYVKTGDIILLKGDLGVGKTTLARAIIRTLANDPNLYVTSPTFPILQIYKLKTITIYHFDLYRIKCTDELLELGIEEALESGVSIVEWPQFVENIINHYRYIDIYIKLMQDGTRECSLNLKNYD